MAPGVQERLDYGTSAKARKVPTLTYLAPPVATTVGAAALTTGGAAVASIALGAGLAAWALMAATYVPMLRHHNRHALESLLLPVAAGLYLLMTVGSAWWDLRHGGAQWKGRRYATG